MTSAATASGYHPATVTIAAVTDTKSYDSTTASSKTPTFQVTSFNTDLGESEPGANTLYNSDAFSSLSQSFDSANAGARTLTASYTISPNYTVTSAATASGTITPATVTIAAVTDTKSYDSTTASSKTPNLPGHQLQYGSGRERAGHGQHALQQRCVQLPEPELRLGQCRARTLTASYTISPNYTVTSAATASGTITPATVTIAAVTDTKSYDSTTASSKTPTFQVTSFNTELGESELGANTLYNSEAFSTLSQSFDSANAGARTLTASYTISPNYTVTSAATASGTITPATVTITAVTDTKSYDSTTASSKTPTFQVTSFNTDLGESELGANTLYNSDNFTTLSESFDSANAGARTLTASYSISPNYTVTSAGTAAGTITPATVTIAAVTDTKSYDSTTASSKTPTFQVTSFNTDLGESELGANTLYNSDAFSSLSQSFDSANAGARTLTASYTISPNYTVTSAATASGTITPATVTIAAVTDTKSYDSTTASSKTPTFQVTSFNTDLGETELSANTLYNSDNFTSLSQSFDSANAGSRTLTTSYSISPNYTVTSASTAAGTITPATVTIAAVTDTKSYDSTTASSKTPTFQVTSFNTDLGEIELSANTLYNSDNFTTLSESFDSANAGARTLTASYSISPNYTVTSAGTAAGTITPATVTIAAVTDTKSYDSTTASSKTPTFQVTSFNTDLGESEPGANTLYNSDSVQLTLSESFDSANAGSRTLTASYTISPNYTVTSVATASGTITPATVTIAAVTDTKSYDSTTASSKTPTFQVTSFNTDLGESEMGANTLYSSDAFSSLSQSFDSANAGARTLTASYSISPNYTVTSTSTAAGTITPATVTIAAVTDTKSYDSTTASSKTPTFQVTSFNTDLGESELGANTLYNSDAFSSLSQSFDSANAGSRTLTASYTISPNYTVTSVATASGTITPATVTIAAVTDTKSYDSTTASSKTPTFQVTSFNTDLGESELGANTLYNSDAFSSLSQSFDSANAGARTLTASYTISPNYTVTSAGTAAGTITPATVTIAAVTDTKSYDSMTASSKTPTFQVTSFNTDLGESEMGANTLYNSDAFSSLSQSFDSANAGARTLTASYTISPNYTVTSAATASGTITPATVTIAAVTDTKSYDSTTASSKTPTFQVTSFNTDLGESELGANTLYNSDAFSSLSQSFDSANAGARTLTASYTISPNFTVTSAATASGTITPATVTIAAVTDTKSYDSATASSKTPTFQVTSFNTDLSETELGANKLYNSDAYTSLTQTFDSANAGSRTLTVATDNFGSNYMVVGTPATAAGTITQATVTVAAVSDTKSYDSTTASGVKPTYQVTSFNTDLSETELGANKLYNSDAYTSLTQTFDSANAGSRTLTVATDNFGSNYMVVGTPATAAGTITQATVTVAAVSDTKSYDSTTASGVKPMYQVTSFNTDLSETELGANKLYNSDAYTSLTQTFDSANAGSRTLTVATDNFGSNYMVVGTPATAAGTITQATVTVAAVSDTKSYDSTTASGVKPMYQVTSFNTDLSETELGANKLYNSDAYTSLTQTFDSANAGSRTLTVATDNFGPNYMVVGTPATAAGTITKATVNIAAVTDTKYYDATTASSKTPTFQVTSYNTDLSETELAANTLYNSDHFTSLTESFDSANAGSRTLTASYSIGANYSVTSTSTAAGTINKANTAASVLSSTNPSSFGQSVTFTATVSNSNTSPIPTGNVQFVIDTVNYGSPVSLNGSGQASITLSTLTVGSHTIAALYANSDGDFQNSNGSLAGGQTVNLSPSGASIYVLDAMAGGALTLSGNADINVGGAVYVDSNSSTAISASGNAQVTATSGVLVVGGVSKSGNASVTKTGTPGATGDPLAGLAYPTASYTGTPISENLSGSSTGSISPGLYSQISVSGNATLKLASGTYIIQGGGVNLSGNAIVTSPGVTFIVEGGGFSVSGNATITGAGVTIFNAGSGYNASTGVDGGTFGALTLSGNASVSAPTSGPYAGVLVFQARDNSKALTLSGNASQGVTGTIYAKMAQLAESGNAQVGSTSNPVSIVVDTLTLSGNAVANALSLSSPAGTVAYSPAQIRAAYGITNLALDGTGQTIAIVDAYDDPAIFTALDEFDTQFGLTTSGPNLYSQYGPASSFLTVLNQNGQPTSLPATDPNGVGTDNWEVEEALDVEWAHAIAPGAQIVLVEANSQALPDLMASVATAASQRGVSVVSISWGFAEGQSVFASDEATYDSYFTTPGVTFVASTGDYGAADPEYPAYSPNVVAVGGTSLTLNADNSYNSETGWGYRSSSVGAFIGSGGGLSMYEPEPAYQQGVQSTGGRTTPDVSLIADPATGAWIADPYNLDPSNPFEIVGGTSLSAPAWAGLFALANQGRAAASESTLNSSTPTDTQQALYSLPQSDYNVITSGFNGYTANAGYNLVTGLGTPVANLLVSDLVAYHGPGTTYSGPTVGPLQSTVLVDTGAGGGSTDSVFSVFDSFTVASNGLGIDQGVGHNTDPSSALYVTPAAGTAEPQAAAGFHLGVAAGPLSQSGGALTPGLGTNGAIGGLMPLTVVSGQSSVVSGQWSVVSGQSSMVSGQLSAWSTARAEVNSPAGSDHSVVRPGTGPGAWGVLDSVLDELASDRVGRPADGGLATAERTIAGFFSPLSSALRPSLAEVTGSPLPADTTSRQDRARKTAGARTWLTDILLAAGFCTSGAGILAARNRRPKSLSDQRGFLKFGRRV